MLMAHAKIKRRQGKGDYDLDRLDQLSKIRDVNRCRFMSVEVFHWSKFFVISWVIVGKEYLEET